MDEVKGEGKTPCDSGRICSTQPQIGARNTGLLGVVKNPPEIFTYDCETIESSRTSWNTAPFIPIGG